MAWVPSPTIPGLDLPPSWSWEGPFPDILPAPPEPTLAPVIEAPAPLPVVVPTIPTPDLGVPPVTPSTPAAGDTGLLEVLLIAGGALLLSRTKGFRIR